MAAPAAQAGKGMVMPRNNRIRWNNRYTMTAPRPAAIWLRAAVISSLGWLAAVLFGSWAGHDYQSPGLVHGVAGAQDVAGAQEADARPAEAAAGELPTVVRIDIPLPIDGLVDKQVQSQIEQALRRLPGGDARPTFVFEFRPKPNTAGEGNDFARALTLARYLSGERLAGVRTVAWLPRSVKGHAVLPVLACEQIIMHKEAELGAAGLDERDAIDALTRRGYTEIAERRKTIPAPVTLGLLDKDLAVYKVRTADGLRFELTESLAALRQEGKVTSEETFFQPGDPHTLSGAQMRELGFATHLADDRRSLATALGVPAEALAREVVPEGGWRPLRVDLNGPVHKKVVNFLLRTIDDHERRGDFNLLFVYIHSGGGDLEQSRRLAERLSSLGPAIHTVAFVDVEARGDAALIATACDELLVTPQAMLGGPGAGNLNSEELLHVRESVAQIARANERDWSLPMALVDPELRVFRCTRVGGGELRYLSPQEIEELPDNELGDKDEWTRDDQPLPTAAGITGQTAHEWGLAQNTVQNLDDAKSLLQIDDLLAAARPNWALAFVEWLADPKIAGLLLFVGIFCLLLEMSSPGISAPGFVSALCFLLFFWAHYLHGTAGWLEILLFVGGVICLAVELFVLPGMGVFGLGGGMMIIVSIVLASQTFVVPTNSYQMRQFPVSLMMVAAGMAGGLAAVFAIRRFLPDTPYLNRMMLQPPAAEEREALSRRESLAIFDHLHGKRGVTSTPLVPAGKAQFGDELVDVRSDGEFLPKGSPVVVADVTGNIVVVRRAPDA
jgi:membrane-bound serine protease (ClpP class)